MDAEPEMKEEQEEEEDRKEVKTMKIKMGKREVEELTALKGKSKVPFLAKVTWTVLVGKGGGVVEEGEHRTKVKIMKMMRLGKVVAGNARDRWWGEGLVIKGLGGLSRSAVTPRMKRAWSSCKEGPALNCNQEQNFEKISKYHTRSGFHVVKLKS